ncbi:NADH-quinone oxidoreductase subunit C [Tessaracoccus sp. OH4464_COT-324]|uniref:NADH-quinone oxidoreductase subunit C n=1 Tax=Tessaracoccus sp. OH4464_COT-324 TaxID=2491059 RepID=UPI000F6328B7|nr:NADH-quinone oxidoreductase subunit C [Tessaracoccus sp. OH4464_COT-324]RRD46969.1 NADH-quinone oxidoreductase subunit C [Tessaracoccus sp. OH4464_COT-324]
MTEQNLPADRPDAPASPVFAKKTGMWSRGSGDTSGYGGMVRELRMPGVPHPPFDDVAADAIHSRALEVVEGFGEFPVLHYRGELTIYVPRERLLEVVAKFRDDAFLRFEVCVSVSGVHYPQQAGAELHSVYHLLSITHNRRVRLEVSCPESDPHIPSIVATYPHADFHEREAWDMFGIIYDGHPGLTRILMPDDWVGHPQRKDYPLGGVDVEYKGATVPAPDNRRSYS